MSRLASGASPTLSWSSATAVPTTSRVPRSLGDEGGRHSRKNDAVQNVCNSGWRSVFFSAPRDDTESPNSHSRSRHNASRPSWSSLPLFCRRLPAKLSGRGPAVFGQHAGEVVAVGKAALLSDLFDAVIALAEQFHRVVEAQFDQIAHGWEAQLGGEKVRQRSRAGPGQQGEVCQRDLVPKMFMQMRDTLRQPRVRP